MVDDSMLEFREIPSLECLYEVNSNGTIIRNAKTKRPLKCFRKRHNGNTQYLCTQVNIRKHIRKVFVHRAVAECWIGERPDGMQVDHIDRNSLNNDYRNLRYVTKSEQMKNRGYPMFFHKIFRNLSMNNNGKVIPVVLYRDGVEVGKFPTSRRAAVFLADQYPDSNIKSFCDKLHLRRSRIFDYDVSYLIEAPDRFDDAKRAEERGRVKHGVGV